MPCVFSLLRSAMVRSELSSLEERISDVNRRIYYDFKVPQALKIVEAANKVFQDRLAVAFSGGKDSLVALHLSLKINPDIPVVFNNTTAEFPETYRYVDRLRREWGINLYVTKHEKPFLKAIQERGWATHQDRWCCRVYKEGATINFLKQIKVVAEVTGATRTESIYRRNLTPFKLFKDGLIRVNPIYDWNYWEVWMYIKDNQLPYNPLYDVGYKRIGCWCCPLNGISHYRRLRKTHSKLYSFLSKLKPIHPAILKLENN